VPKIIKKKPVDKYAIPKIVKKQPVDKDNKNHYINNKEFLAALIEYQADIAEKAERGEKKPYVTEYIARCFLQIAQRLSFRPNFINYTYKDDMISDGLENCLAYMHNFNPDKSNNPFAYFTQIIYYAFLRRIQKEKKQQYVKYKYFDTSGGFERMDSLQEHDKESFDYINERGSTDFHIHIKEFIDDMETKEAEKKAKREAKKKEKEEKHNLSMFMGT
jgi:DNA-directed RNA polymerase specialized sigma24 family protein